MEIVGSNPTSVTKTNIMNIHLKIESKKLFNPLRFTTEVTRGLDGKKIVKQYYETFEMLYGLEYKVQKLSKKARRNWPIHKIDIITIRSF